MPIDYDYFRNKVDRSKLSRNDKKSLLDNITQLEISDLPVILDLHDFQRYVPQSAKDLAAMVNAPHHFYRRFKIPKRSGGEREILAPFPSLANVQRWITSEILSKADLHDSAIAYRADSSTKDHVWPHVGRLVLFRADIRNFFPSITIDIVRELFSKIGYSISAARLLAQLVTLDQSVPQGAPSSPALSNAVCFSLDCAVTEISHKHGLHYTRYADDFAFSGDAIPTTFVNELSEVLDTNGFGLNHKKTRLYGSKENVRFLTGLVLTPDRIRPPKHFRRWIRQRLFYLERFMVTDLDAPRDARSKSELLQNAFLLDSLRGKIGYWIWVDPLDIEAQDHLWRLNRIDAHLAA